MGQRITLSAIIALFILYEAFLVYTGMSALDGFSPFSVRYRLYIEILSYIFLAMFIFMMSVNVALMRQIRAREGSLEWTSQAFKKEKTILLVVLVCFEFSYASRFIYD